MTLTWLKPIYDDTGVVESTEELQLPCIRMQRKNKLIVRDGVQNSSDYLIFLPADSPVQYDWELSHNGRIYRILNHYQALDLDDQISHLEVLL